MKALYGIFAAYLLLAGCAVPPSRSPQTSFPPYNLGIVNTSGDDIASFIDPSDGLLYFTTDGLRDTTLKFSSEGCLVPDQDLAVARPISLHSYDTARWRGSHLARMLSILANNEGNIAFRTATEGFFASGHPFEESYARRLNVLVGGIVGGSDLFHFRIQPDSTMTVENLRHLNSFYWDAHPTVAERNDTLLLIWSSDRPSHGERNFQSRGYSAPFRNQRSFDGRDTVIGNADLYYAFFTPAGWSQPHNLNDALGQEINTRGNEYSPFIFCIDRQPVLYYASDRGISVPPSDTTLDSTLNIWAAYLDINFGAQHIVARRIEKLPIGDDSVNSLTHHEMFPFIPQPHEQPTGTVMLYFASDRDDSVRHWSDSRLQLRKSGQRYIRSKGGFDLYAIPIQTSCRPPRVFYTVHLVDAEDPLRPIPEPVIVLEGSDGTRQERRASHARFELRCGVRYHTRGGSLYDSIVCNSPAERIMSSYASRRTVELEPHLERKRITSQITIVRSYDTVRRPMLLPTHLQFRPNLDTAAFGTMARLTFTLGDSDRFVGLRRRSQHVVDVLFLRPRQKPDTVTRTIVETIDITRPRIDTIIVSNRQELARSALSLRGGFPECSPQGLSQEDIELNDTILIEPQYYTFPPCQRTFVRDTQFIRNVPYFQTSFWQVNTTKGLAEHMRLFSTAHYTDASFIELHRRNQYWGPDYLPNDQQRAKRQERHRARIEQYRRYATYVDRNYALITKSICDTLLPSFVNMLERMSADPGTESAHKLIISVTAYSDARPVNRGYYIGEQVRYFSAHFDTATFRIIPTQPHEINIPHHAGLGGQRNDTLSMLRAYNGYVELLDYLRTCPLFAQMEQKGLVLLPTDVRSQEEFELKLRRCQVIVVVEGRQVDSTVVAEVPGYATMRLLQVVDPRIIARMRPGDYFEYDNVRRVDMSIHRAYYSGGVLIRPPCGCKFE